MEDDEKVALFGLALGIGLRPPELAEGLRLDLAFCDRTVPINS